MTERLTSETANAEQSVNSKWSILEKVAQKYDSEERTRIDRIKQEIEADPWGNIEESEMKQVSPTLLRKLGRVALDSLGIRNKRSERRRNQEASAIAKQELRDEQETKRQTAIAAEQRQKVEAERRAAEYAAWQSQMEQAALERDLSEAHDVLSLRKHDRLRNQRAQEMTERSLNSRLLTVNHLEEEVLSKNPEVAKRTIMHEGGNISVYDLKGIPFTMLTHTVDYRNANKPGEIGTETYRAVMENPAIWAEQRSEAEQTTGFGTRSGNARGDTISTSYTTSGHNFDSRVPGELVYGFDHVVADSIISVSNGDGGTSNMAGRNETTINEINPFKRLEGAGSTRIYNEVLLRRYSETGAPKKPDYIVTENDKITETILKHASYFKIPIINIQSDIYRERMKQHGRELLDSISASDSYTELDQKIAELSSLSEYKPFYHDLTAIGRGRDIPQHINPTETERRCFEISQLELKKRIDFIANTLTKAIADTQLATERGESATTKLPGTDYFHIGIEDVQNSLTRYLDSDSVNSFYRAPGNCNSVNVKFKLKDSSRFIDTSIYDGEHMLEVEKALTLGTRQQADIDNADSSYYERIAPLATAYFAAYRENRAKTKK